MNIWAVGRNYRDHAKELGNTVPSKPMIFLKSGSTIEAGQICELWNGSNDIHHEIEIALRFGSPASSREVSQDLPKDLHFDAAALALDLTARDHQARLKSEGHPWTLAKSFRGSCPLGRFIEIPAQVPHFEFELSVNGAVRQHGSTKDMVFDFETLRRYVLENFPVVPGDLLLTGTPAGVSRLASGDRAEAWFRSENGHESRQNWIFR